MFEQVYIEENKPYCAVCGDTATCKGDNYGRLFDMCDACHLDMTKDMIEAEHAAMED